MIEVWLVSVWLGQCGGRFHGIECVNTTVIQRGMDMTLCEELKLLHEKIADQTKIKRQFICMETTK